MQNPAEVVDVSGWREDEDFAIFPVGSKPKRAMFCPTPSPQPFLLAGHRYLFKVSTGWRIHQHWSEIIAYEIAQLAGIPAAPCFLGVDERRDEVGALVEFFYGYPGVPITLRFVPGADLLRRLYRNYEASPDKYHVIQTNVSLARAFKVPRHIEYWGRILAFDGLIGNTDRHPENWGLLATVNPSSGQPTFTLAPSFDHGTSLGYTIREADLGRESQEDRISLHVSRGRHHMRWRQSKDGTGHAELCRQYSKAYPAAVPEMRGVLDIPMTKIQGVVHHCCRFDIPTGRFSEARAEYVLKLIAARRQTLKDAVGG